MTFVAQALAEGTQWLRAASETPRAEAMLLLEHALQRRREWIVASAEVSLSASAAAVYRELCERRRAGVPAAYILGRAGFYGRDFLVDERVLIPRPETELLVDEAIAFADGRHRAVLDVGTGSGAIACTIAAETDAIVHATDISEAALDVARENARRLGVEKRCTFHHGYLSEPVRGLRFDIAIANLPYVPTADVPAPPNPVAFEPRVATDGGPDGLRLYRELLEKLPAVLAPESLALLEAAPPTIQELRKLVCRALPDFAVSVHKDYAGLERYIKAKGPSTGGGTQRGAR